MELPRRIVDGGASDWERSLLLSAGKDVPSQEFRRRLRRTLGVAALGAGLATTTTASAKPLGGVLLKWLALGFSVGTLSVGAATYATRALEGRAPVQGNASAPSGGHQPLVSGEMPVQDPRPSDVSSVMAPAGPPPTAAFSVPRTHPSRPAEERALAVLPESVTTRQSPAGQTQLSEEIAAIKGARAAVAQGDANRALAELDRYERAYPAGLFKIEAQVLRIDALLDLGQYATARELGQRFLAAQPDSPYAQHVRSVASAATGTNR